MSQIQHDEGGAESAAGRKSRDLEGEFQWDSKPAPYTDYSSATKTWNSAYATLTTHAEVCDGYYATYEGGYWTKSLPLNYSASTGGITHITTSNGIKCQSTVKFTFGATSSTNFIVNTYHYYK